ncbi:MAG TPA: lysine transporter LysE, partial [Sulfitobacter sp.]|nr:lysine transporter LysE [Sulfitobacter sp.]
MELSHLIAFNIALIASILSPGPAFLIALKTTLSSGRRAGVAVGLGLGLVASFWTLAALL